MRRNSCIVFLVLVLFSLSNARAVVMKDLFANMPDSMIPYLTRNNRLDCIDFKMNKMDAVVKNSFDENSTLLELTDNYLLMNLNDNTQMELKLLLTGGGKDTVVCKIITYKAPEAESDIEFYSCNWVRLNTNDYLSMPSSDVFWCKPDTMTEERYNTLRTYIDPVMIEAHLSLSDDNITLQLSKPLLSVDDKKALNAVLLQKKLVWDGKSFK